MTANATQPSDIRRVRFNPETDLYEAMGPDGAVVQHFFCDHARLTLELREISASELWMAFDGDELVEPDDIGDFVADMWHDGEPIDLVDGRTIAAHAVPPAPIRWVTIQAGDRADGEHGVVEPLEFLSVQFTGAAAAGEFSFLGPFPDGTIVDERAQRGTDAHSEAPAIQIDLPIDEALFASLERRILSGSLREGAVQIALPALVAEDGSGEAIYGKLPAERGPMCVFAQFENAARLRQHSRPGPGHLKR